MERWEDGREKEWRRGRPGEGVRGSEGARGHFLHNPTPYAQGPEHSISYIIIMLRLEGSKEAKKAKWKNGSSQIQSQNNQGTLWSFYSRWLEKAGAVACIFPLLFSLFTFHNFTSNASGQLFLFTSHSPPSITFGEMQSEHFNWIAMAS